MLSPPQLLGPRLLILHQPSPLPPDRSAGALAVLNHHPLAGDLPVDRHRGDRPPEDLPRLPVAVVQETFEHLTTAGLAEVDQAVGQMDQVIQQNAAMADEFRKLSQVVGKAAMDAAKPKA